MSVNPSQGSFDYATQHAESLNQQFAIEIGETKQIIDPKERNTALIEDSNGAETTHMVMKKLNQLLSSIFQ